MDCLFMILAPIGCFVIGIAIGIPCTGLGVTIHENLHVLVTKIVGAQIGEFKDKVCTHVSYKKVGRRRCLGFTESNLYKFLEKNPSQYALSIKLIAYAGHSSVWLYGCIVLVCCVGCITLCCALAIPAGFFLLFLLQELASYHRKSENVPSDRLTVKHPEEYKYDIPDWVKEMRS